MTDENKTKLLNVLQIVIVAIVSIVSILFGVNINTKPGQAVAVSSQAITYMAAKGTFTQTSLLATGYMTGVETGIYDEVEVHGIVANSSTTPTVIFTPQWSDELGVSCANGVNYTTYAGLDNNAAGQSATSQFTVTGSNSQIILLPIRGFCFRVKVSETSADWTYTPTIYYRFVKNFGSLP
jgi:hypothetical protein